MNVLFIVEGKRTEKLIYKKWVPYIHPSLQYCQISSAIEFIEHISQSRDSENLAILTGGGYPGYFKIISDIFRDIGASTDIDYVIICVDSEDQSYDEKMTEIKNFIENDCIEIAPSIFVIIQHHCIETWLLANKRINIIRTQTPELRTYREFYNVNRLDPELMPQIDSRSIGSFTFRYLKLMLAEKNLTYSKSHVNCVTNRGYFNQIVRRYEQEGHIPSFGRYYDILRGIPIE